METSPLLGDDGRPAAPGAAAPSSAAGRKPSSAMRVTTLLSLMVFFFATSGALANVPVTRILEDRLCREYYGADRHLAAQPIDEDLCKIDGIQSELAYLNGLLYTFESVVGLVTALPYGVLADRIGRKFVLVLSGSGTVLSLLFTTAVLRFGQAVPLRAVLFAPACQVIGGGSAVIIAAIYAMIADVVSARNRASAFVFPAFASLMGSFVGPVLSSALMQATSPWVPLLLAAAAETLGVSFILFVSETLPTAEDPPGSDGEGEGEGEGVGDEQERRRVVAAFKQHLRHFFVRFKDSAKMLTGPSLAVVLLTFLTVMPGFFATSQFFVQYISKRFHWSLAEAGYLLSVRGIVNILVLLVALPALSRYLLDSVGLSTPRKDHVLAIASAACLAAGALLLAGGSVSLIVVGLVVNTLGAGLPPVSRSLATVYVDAQNISKLYTLISMLETVGSLFAGPALAGLFTAGLRLGGGWLGLPYLGLAGMFLLTTLGFVLVRIPEQSGRKSRDASVDPEVDGESAAGGN